MGPPVISGPGTGHRPSPHNPHQLQHQAQQQQALQQIQQNMLPGGSSPKQVPSRSSVSPPLRTSSSFRVDEGYSEDMQIVDDLMSGRRRFQFSSDRFILPDWMLALDESVREGMSSERARVAPLFLKDSICSRYYKIEKCSQNTFRNCLQASADTSDL